MTRKASGRARAPAVQAEGPIDLSVLGRVHLFPVRHHSPRSAATLERFLDEVRPEAVLVEGPADATPLIEALVDPATISDEEREERGIVRLPDSLSAALDALRDDAVLTDALGPLLMSAYTAVRRSEWSAFSTQGSAFEHKHHFWKY